MRFIKHFCVTMARLIADIMSSLYLFCVHKRNPGRDIYYCVCNMGEVAIAMSYIPAEKPILFILRKDKVELANLYDAGDIHFKFIGKFVFWFLSKQTSYSFFSNCESTSHSRLSELEGDKIVNLELYSGNFVLPRLGMNVYQIYRKTFSMANGRNGYSPTFNCKLPQSLASLCEKKCIVINPYANTVKCDISVFWSSFVKLAHLNGYTAICLVHGNQSGIAGCNNIECTLGEIGSFLKYTGSVLVALRSGFVDVMIHAQTPVFCLEYTEFKRYKLFLFNSQEIEEINPDVNDILFDSKSDFRDLAKVVVEEVNKRYMRNV